MNFVENIFQEKVSDIVRILPSGIVCFGMHKLNRRQDHHK